MSSRFITIKLLLILQSCYCRKAISLTYFMSSKRERGYINKTKTVNLRDFSKFHVTRSIYLYSRVSQPFTGRGPLFKFHCVHGPLIDLPQNNLQKIKHKQGKM